MDPLVFLLNASIAPMWVITAVRVGFFDRRWMIGVGFMLAGYRSVTSAVLYANGTLPEPVEVTAYVAGIVLTGLICGAAWDGRTRRRPTDGWTP